MADNVTTGTTGLTILADEVTEGTLGTGKAQFVKVMDGTIDGTNKLAVDSSGRVGVVTSGSTLAATQSGTWTVQPGNTPNTTPWLTSISSSTASGLIKAASTAPASTDPALVVALSPNGLNSNGQTTMANSEPVVGASDWIELIGGDVAAGSSDSGKPVKIGGITKTTQPSTVNDGQRVNALFDKLGKQVVVHSIRDLKINSIATSSTTTETALLSPVASTFLDLYGFIATNTSSQAVNISVKDSSGGTTQFNIAVPSGDTRGFMLNESAAIVQGTVNKAWTTTLSTALASGSISITGLAVKNV